MDMEPVAAAQASVAEITDEGEARRFVQDYQQALVRQLHLTAGRQARQAANGDWCAVRRSGERINGLAAVLCTPRHLPRAEQVRVPAAMP